MQERDHQEDRYDLVFYEKWTNFVHGSVEYMALYDFYDEIFTENEYKEAVGEAKVKAGTYGHFEASEELELARLRFALVRERLSQRLSQIKGYNSAYSDVMTDFDELTAYFEKDSDEEGAVQVASGYLYDIINP